MSHSEVLNISITMRHQDGTYMLQTFAPEQPATPRETVFDVESIPQGLRMLAATMEATGTRAFGRRASD